MVIFVCGVITGALVIETQGLHRSPSGPGGPSYGPPGPRPVFDIIRRMTQAHIELTTDQTNRIVKIMQDSQATNAAIRVKYAPQLQAEKERAQKAINQLLTSGQQQKFTELMKRSEQRPDGRGRRGGEGGGFQRNTNRFPSNGLPDEERGRMSRRSLTNNLSTNGPSTDNPSTNNP